MQYVLKQTSYRKNSKGNNILLMLFFLNNTLIIQCEYNWQLITDVFFLNFYDNWPFCRQTEINLPTFVNITHYFISISQIERELTRKRNSEREREKERKRDRGTGRQIKKRQ